MLIYNDSKIEGIFNSYLINFRFDTKYSKYELELKDIKKVLQDLSILLCYDLEPCHDIICAKFSNIKGISYPFFKECLYNFLDKKEMRLNTMFLAEQNSIPLENAKTVGNNNLKKHKYEETENIEEVKITDDLNLIILHRSLYILKKKFEKYKTQVKNIYNKYSEKIFELENKGDILENEILVEKNQVIQILVEVLNTCNIEIDEFNNFKDVIFKEMEYLNNIKIKDNILKEFMDYVNDNRRKYNYIYKEKKINKNFHLESYIDYIPQGDDELTKVVIETEGNEKDIKNDNISEIVHNKLKFHELNKDANKDVISEISKNKNIEEIKENEKESFNGEILVEKKNKNEKKDEKKYEKNDEENEEEEYEDNNNENNEENEDNKKNKLINKNKIKKNSFYSEIGNKKTIKYSKYFLYIESLPLIIADFISNQNKSYIILEHGDDLRNDLRTLFDNEILSRLGEEITYEINRNKMEQLKDLLINKSKVEKNISCYEDLLYQMRTHNQNISFVLITINKLKNTLDWIEKKINVIQDDTNTFNEYENNVKLQKLNEELKLQKKKYLNNENKQKLNKNNIIKTNKNENKDNISINSKDSKTNGKINNINNISFKDKDKDKEVNSNNESKKDIVNYSRRLSEISENSILKLDNKIEGMDTARLIDSNLINQDNLIFKSKNKKNVENSENKNFFNYKKNNIGKLKLKNELTKEEKRELNIKEIFNFYSHQHSNAGHKTTFDSIRDKFEHLNLSEFAKFCIEFKILLPKEKIVEIFKKSATLTKEMSFQEFKVALSKISLAINEDKIKQLKKRIQHFKNTLNYNNRNITIENLKKEQVDELIKKCKEDIKQLNKKKSEDLLEEFYEYLQIDDEEKYHQKMKGFVLPIFNGGILQTVQGEQNTKNIPVKINIGRQIYIKEMIEKRKEEKNNIQKNIIKVNGLDREYQKKKLDKNNNAILKTYGYNKLEPIKKNNSNYSDSNIANNNKTKKLNDILNIKVNDEIKSNIEDKLSDNNNQNIMLKNNKNNKNSDLNSFPRKLNDLINDQEAEKEVSEQLNFKLKNNYGNINMNPLLLNNKNNKKVQENKYTWDSLEKMKSNNLVDESELNKLIN